MQITGIQTGYLGTSTWIVPVAGFCGGAFFVTDPGGDSRDAAYITKTLGRLAAGKLSAADASKEAEQALKAVPRVAGFVMTHGHFDHVGALPFLHAAFPNAAIAIHEKDAAYFGPEAAQLHIEDFTALQLADYVEETLDGNPLPEATALLEDGGVLPFAPEWKILHTPGHSPGSICLFCEDAAHLLDESDISRGIKHVMLSGDTLFEGTCGRTDLRGGSSADMKRSLSRLENCIPHGTLILPGHGGPFVNFDNSL